MEKFMEMWFIENVREFGGIPITKDNCEDLFENWLCGLDVDDWLEFGELYANKK